MNFLTDIALLPEPYEIPLYLLISVILALILFACLRFILPAIKKYQFPFSLKILSFAILSAFFIFMLGTYPMAGDTIFIQSLVDLYSSRVVVVIFSLFVLFLLIQSEILGRVSRKLFFGLILIFIAILVFEPGLPAAGHDFSYFLGPIDEIVKGKTIYSQVPSYYGFLSVLLYALITKAFNFNLFYLPLINWFLYIIEYGLIFFILYRISRTFWLPLLGIFSIITVNYYSSFHLPGTYFQIGPMRWLPLLLSLFIVYLNNNLTSKKVIFAIALLSIFNIEVGMALIFSYSLTLFFLFLGKQITFKKAFISGLYLGFFVGLFFLLINLLSFVFGYGLINVSEMTDKLKQFAVAGANMIPIPKRSYFWLVPLIYFASIIYFFKEKVGVMSEVISPTPLHLRFGGFEGQGRKSRPARRSDSEGGREGITSDRIYFFDEGIVLQNLTQLLIFSANITLFASVYFVGRSHPHNLFHISIFPLFTFFLLIFLLIKKPLKAKNKIMIVGVIFLLFIFYPAWQRSQALASMFNLKLHYLRKGAIFKPELENKAKMLYQKELVLIKKYINEDNTAILSVDDSYLFYLTGKKNLLFDNPQTAMGTKRDLDRAFREVKKSCPKKIVASCTVFNLCPPYQTISSQFIDLQSILMNKFRDVCKKEFKPVQCTEKLCVAELK